VESWTTVKKAIDPAEPIQRREDWRKKALTRPATTLSHPIGEGKRLSRSSRLSQGEKKNYDYSISLKSKFSRISR
jgi:hypothetical protein